MGPRDGLDRCGKSHPHGDLIPGPSSPIVLRWRTYILCRRGTREITALQTSEHAASVMAVVRNEACRAFCSSGNVPRRHEGKGHEWDISGCHVWVQMDMFTC